jgi:uncharacterized protein YndB with AHSA1/START domain
MSDKATNRGVTHETLTFERTYRVPPQRVFAAYADVAARARWGTPSDTAAIVYSAADFSVGGQDAYRCGAKDDLRFRGITRYEDIVENQRIVYVESVSTQGKLLAVSLITWELLPHEQGTRLIVTDQLTALDGSDMSAGTRFGMNAALDNLARELAG